MENHNCVQVMDDSSEVAKRAPPRNSPQFVGFMNGGGGVKLCPFYGTKGFLAHFILF